MRWWEKGNEEIELEELEEAEELEEEGEGEKHLSLGIKITKILIFYLVIGFVGWNFFYFMFNSEYCEIKEVIIKGNNQLSEEEIFYKSQIKLGDNIFKLSKDNTINYLKQDPWIKEAEVKRVIPDKIIISVEEREPSAIIYFNEEYFMADQEGMVLSQIVQPAEEFLPLITGLETTELKVGKNIIEPEFRTALEIINSANLILPDKFYKIKILAPDDFLIFSTVNDLVVRASQAEEMVSKGYLLKEAFEKIIKENLVVEYIDMRFKDRAVIKVKEQ